MAHYFHMLVDQKTIGDLMLAGGLTKVKKIPGLIRDIIVDFYHKVEKLHFTGESRKSRYTKISDVGPEDNKRKSLWIPRMLPRLLHNLKHECCYATYSVVYDRIWVVQQSLRRAVSLRTTSRYPRRFINGYTTGLCLFIILVLICIKFIFLKIL